MEKTFKFTQIPMPLSHEAPVFVPGLIGYNWPNTPQAEVIQSSQPNNMEQENTCLKMRSEYIERKKNRLREKLVDADKIIQDLQEKVKSLEEERSEREIHTKELLKDAEKQISDLKCIQESHEENVETLMQTVTRMELEISRKSSGNESWIAHLEDRWMGNTLRLNWIIKEAAKVGALRLPDHEWVTDMAHDLEYPNEGTVSIFSDIPRHIRERYLPQYGDAHIEFIEEEEENVLIEQLSEEASWFSRGIPEPLEQLLQNDRGEALKKISLIQKIFRGILSRRVRYTRCPVGIRVVAHLQKRRILSLFNTGPDRYQYGWIQSCGAVSNRSPIAPFSNSDAERISSFSSHSFQIYNVTQNWSKVIRIPCFGSHTWEGEGYYFDVHTGISVSQSQFLNIQSRHINPNQFSVTTIIPNNDNNIIQQHNEYSEEDDDESFQTRILIAIQLSLETETDNDDYGETLSNLFN
jgi:hypothetical protein